MSTLNSLKLVASKKHQSVAPIVIRRNKLVAKLHEQLELCEAKRSGNTYAPKRLKTFTDKHSGERKTIETIKRVKEWFWTGAGNKINLSVRYGSKTLELAKGKNAIELATSDELIATLAALKEAVLAGELDDAISSASDKLRAGFGK